MSMKKSNLTAMILTPFLITAIAAAVIVLVSIKPYNKISVYLRMAFMDDLKTVPGNGTNGLIIQDNDISTDNSGKTSDTGEVKWPLFGEQFAVIRSDSLPLSIPVYWGSTPELLQLGACQATSSVPPGKDGNSVISAHADTFFADLHTLKQGDEITVYTLYGRFTYKVTDIIEFNKKNKKYVIPSDDTRLTLYTCKPDILGASDVRIGVICKPEDMQFYAE